MIGLGIDYGPRHIGIALVEDRRVLYAATIEVAAKLLLATTRPCCARCGESDERERRTAADCGVWPRPWKASSAREQIVRFCRRRGYSHEPKAEELGLAVARGAFFETLRGEIERTIALPLIGNGSSSRAPGT